MDNWDVGNSAYYITVFTTVESAYPSVERILWETVWSVIRDPLEGCVTGSLGDTVEESIKELIDG